MTPSPDLIVLAVDDETDNAELVRRCLQTRGDVNTLVASSGTEALALLQGHRVAAIVLDHRMPAMTGVELLERAKIMGHLAPSIMLTAVPDDPAVQDANRRGLVRCVISKPWQPDDLLMAIDMILRMPHKREK